MRRRHPTTLQVLTETFFALAAAYGVVLLFVLVVVPVLLSLGGCVTDQALAVEHVETKTADIPEAVRCFKSADIPVQPQVISADVKTATPHQLAEASAGNAEAWILYGKAMAKQFKQCEDSAPETTEKP